MLKVSKVQSLFVQQLPTLQKMAKIQFRNLSPEAKQESITNAIGLAWKFYFNLAKRHRAQEHGHLGVVHAFCNQADSGRSHAARLPTSERRLLPGAGSARLGSMISTLGSSLVGIPRSRIK